MVRGDRQRGKPAKRWLDGIRTDIKQMNLHVTLTKASRTAQARKQRTKLCKGRHHSTQLKKKKEKALSP